MTQPDKIGGIIGGGVSELISVVTGFGSRLDTVSKRVDEVSQRLIDHMEREEGAIHRLTSAMESLKDEVEALSSLVKAFPHDGDGVPDLYGHRRYHEGLIEEHSGKIKFWQSVKEQVGKNMVTGLMALLVLGINAYIVQAVTASKEQQSAQVQELMQKQTEQNARMLTSILEQHDQQQAEKKRK